MVRKPASGLTEAEERIMRVLWDRGEASVREVADALEAKVAYNTVLTLLGILKDKGVVTHRKEGRAFIYRALLSEAEAQSKAVDRLVQALFKGAPDALAAHLIKTADLDRDRLDALRRELDSKADDMAGKDK